MHAAAASPPTHLPITSARVKRIALPGGKHFTTHLEGPLHARDPPNTCPPTPPRACPATPPRASTHSPPTTTHLLLPVAARRRRRTPDRQLRAAHAKRITASPQTLQHTPRGSPARTGPNQHLPTPARTENAARHPPVARHTRRHRVATHAPTNHECACQTNLRLRVNTSPRRGCPARTGPSLAANYAPRTSNESPPHRKRFNTHLEGPLHARDPPTTRPPTPVRAENAGGSPTTFISPPPTPSPSPCNNINSVVPW